VTGKNLQATFYQHWALYFTLALSLPSVDKKWLADFSQSLKALAKQYNISLVGGDTPFN
jgi:thiamine monophosphate kinase